MSVAEVVTTGLAPNEFEVSLGSLGVLRGRVDPRSIMEAEKRLGSFMGLAKAAIDNQIGFAQIVTLIEVLVHPVMGRAAPKREEIESGVLEAGLRHVVTALYTPFAYALNGSAE